MFTSGFYECIRQAGLSIINTRSMEFLRELRLGRQTLIEEEGLLLPRFQRERDHLAPLTTIAIAIVRNTRGLCGSGWVGGYLMHARILIAAELILLCVFCNNKNLPTPRNDSSSCESWLDKTCHAWQEVQFVSVAKILNFLKHMHHYLTTRKLTAYLQ